MIGFQGSADSILEGVGSTRQMVLNLGKVWARRLCTMIPVFIELNTFKGSQRAGKMECTPYIGEGSSRRRALVGAQACVCIVCVCHRVPAGQWG